ncbi:MAG: hypothetical protein Q9226_004454, partial [Calogaya cf. arnoldii]
ILPHPVVPEHIRPQLTTAALHAHEHTLTTQGASTHPSASIHSSAANYSSPSVYSSASSTAASNPVSCSVASGNFETSAQIYQEKLATGLLLTNRQVHKEASAVLYSKDTFIMCDPAQDIEWLNTIGQHNVQQLKSLELITNRYYTTFTGGEDSNRAFWIRLLDHLARIATGLRHLSLIFDTVVDEHAGYTFAAVGEDPHFAMALGAIQCMPSMVIDGYYGEDWPGFLTEKMGVEVREASRGLGEWRNLRSYQVSMRDLDIKTIYNHRDDIMRMLATTSLAALWTIPALASFHGNLNYESPSRLHPNLGISVPIVERRSYKRAAVAYKPSELNFTHGIASGDPYPDSVIIWTRIAPSLVSSNSNVTVEGTVPLYNHDTEPYIAADANPICVNWKLMPAGGNGNLSAPGNSTRAVASGTAYTTGDIDYTVKVEATGLTPFTAYRYQFTMCGSDKTSPMGLTKTAPAEDADIDEVKLAVFSCSNYPVGYFNPYGNAARKAQHDYVIHLGDYLYEGAAGGPRAHNPLRLLFSLYDYRTRHGQYRSDPDQQLLSKDFAWITTWDDHEVANNGYRDGFSGLNNTEESFRNDGPMISGNQVDLDDNLRIWRNFKMGKLMDFIVLDTRNYDRSITSLGWNDDYIDLIRDDASRTLMGSNQENWFYRQLSESSSRGATWRVIGNQIIFSRIVSGSSVSGDNWNGYTANRNRTLKHLYDNNIGNNVFLAGDSHQNWVSDLVWLGEEPYDNTAGTGALGVEFAGTSVTSTGNRKPIAGTDADARARVAQNEVLQWQDGYYKGYFLMTVGKDKIETQFFGSPTVATRNAWDLPLANFTVLAGDNRLSRPVAGGSVESGKNGTWAYVSFPRMYIST